ncbi:MAG: hypothetical protein K1W20_08240 [Lachnospiraceae bacterium]
MKRETDKLLNRWIKALPWICLVGLFVYLSVFMQLRGDMLTDSDISSEMLLAEILNGEHALISRNWFYSTELRVLNIQLLYSFFFHFFRDWTMVRTGACVVSYLLMLVSYYYMMRQMGQEKIYAVSAIFLLLPVSDGYFEYVLLALLYASFISISFFAVGMVFHYARASTRMKKAVLAFTVVLAFMTGLGGIRHLVVLYLPLFAATVLMALIQRKPSGYLACSAVGLVASCTGYLVNSCVLAGHYWYETWVGGMKFRVSVQGIRDLFFGTLRAFGYSYGDGKPTPIASAFSCVLALVMVVCVARTVVKKWGESEPIWLLAVYFTGVYGIFFCMYTFTDMLYSDRYNMAAMVFAIPLMILNLSEITWNRYVKTGLLVFLGGGILLSGIFRYARYGSMDKTAQLRPIVTYLVQEEGACEGYATFWNGNVLRELSDGAIDVWVWEDDLSTLRDVDDVLPWLQNAAHQITRPEGRVFVLLTEEEYGVCSFQGALSRKKADYQSEDYLLFLFDSYEELTEAVR